MLQTKKELSAFYIRNGISIIPIKHRSKRAILKGWNEYGNRQPTQEEVNKWFRSDKNRNEDKDEGKDENKYEIGIVLGFGNLLGIDCDDPTVTKILFDTTIEEASKKTWIVKTGRGYHVYFKYQGNCGTIKKENVIEVYGGGRYFLAPPSTHPNGKQYSFLTDIDSVGIKELTDREYDLLFKRCQKIGKFFPFIKTIVPRWEDGMRHNVVLPLSGFLRKNAHVSKKDTKFIVASICRLAEDDDVMDRLTAVDDTWKKPMKEISGVSGLTEIYDEGFVKKLESSLGISRAKSKKNRDKNNGNEEDNQIIAIETPSLVTDTFIAEEVWNPPNLPQFAVYEFATGKITFKDAIEVALPDQDSEQDQDKEQGKQENLNKTNTGTDTNTDTAIETKAVEDDAEDKGNNEKNNSNNSIIYIPIRNDHIYKGMVILPRAPVECTFEEVIPEAIDFVRSGFDPCGKNAETKLYVLLAMESWILDRERSEHPIAGVGVFAPILPIRGPSGSGKNRLANMLRFLSYHPFFDVSTSRIPSLFRPLDLWKGTLVIDEGDFKNTGENSELIHFLNARATGTPIGRQNPNNPSECQVFDSFGITIITQRRHFDDNATEGRAIPMRTDIGKKDFPTIETQKIIDKGRDMQDRLLYLRMKYWNDIYINKSMWIEGTSDHRLNSALIPLMALSRFAPWIEDFIKSLIKPIERERRKVKAQSADGMVINAMWDKISDGEWDTHNKLFFIGNGKEYLRRKANQDSIDGLDEDAEEMEEIIIPMTSTALGESLKFSGNEIRKIISSLNITPEQAPATARINGKVKRPIFFDPIRLEKRLVEFVVDYEKGSMLDELRIKDPNKVSESDGDDGEYHWEKGLFGR